ncbi:exported protein of unknown function [Nitrospira japonica]|uniref:Uncharacterized protein n=1 Tax=Nitrospira japonica TaxID=1325564 RepID=A0A1W1I7Y9_9BACT|nr:hypothetical protein [Nitrospira japonica]SLM48923.1 exported protein of unknown function [Nitrospira japonica]
MKRLALPAVLLLVSVSTGHAESLCRQCFDAAKQELKKCMEAAISAEDKATCHQKHDAKSTTCEEGECKLEQAAKPSLKDKPASEPLPERK